MAETPSSSPGSDVLLAVLRAAVDELRSLAHDPTMVHAAATKLKDGIDALERALTQEPKAQTQEQKRS